MNLHEDSRLPARFWGKITLSPTGCWEWTASCGSDGYGRFWWRDRWQRAHRVAFIELVGKHAPGLELDHLCQNRRCANPAHLEAVTHTENVRRGKSPAVQLLARTTCAKGHPLEPYPWGRGRYCKTCCAERQRVNNRNYRQRLKAVTATAEWMGGGFRP